MQSDPRKTPTKSEKLWYLASLWFKIRDTQHVQRVSGDVTDWCCWVDVSGYGCATQGPLSIDPCQYHVLWCEISSNMRHQILRVVEVEKTEDIRRPYIRQLLTKDLKFPLPHRVPRRSTKKIFAARRPSTFFWLFCCTIMGLRYK